MINLIYQFLSWRYAGTSLIAIAIVKGLIFATFFPGTGGLFILLIIVSALGNAKFLFVDSNLAPTPGELFEVNGAQAHLYIEGTSSNQHPVIWVAGGHGEGLVLAHLHKEICKQTRSILFDRAGSGWSQATSFPLTITQEVEHLNRLLLASNQTGPFVLAGHSFGGLFCLNYAHHYPDQVAGLVLMDPTPPENVTFAGRISFAGLIAKAPWRALALHFGITAAGDPEIDDYQSSFYRCLKTDAETINRNSIQPKSVVAEAAAFRAAMDNPEDMVIGENALSDIPMRTLLANPTEEEIQQTKREVRQVLEFSDLQELNFWRMMDTAVEQQTHLSSRGQKVFAPLGSSHMFPYEHPEFVLQQVQLLTRQD